MHELDPTLTQLAEATLRWIHVLAGVVWVGQLSFLTLVNAIVAQGFEGDTRRKVLPEVMPRALYFGRWSALLTWVTGLMMIGLVYHLGGLMVPTDATSGQKAAAFAVSQALIFFGFFVYDLLCKARAGVAVLILLFVGTAFGLSQLMAGRAMWLHLGAILGSVMTLNVWMRIWPAWKKVIRGIRETGPVPGPEVAEAAGLRAKHNLYLSIPVLLFMVAPHTFPLAYGDTLNWLWATVALLAGFAMARVLLWRANSAAPMKAP